MATFNIDPNSLTGVSLLDTTIARGKLTTDTKYFEIPLSAWKIWDSLQQLPTTSSSDDLGWYAGTWLTNAPLIRTADVKTTSPTLRARAQVELPAEYEPGGEITLRAFCGMVTTVADGSATIDFEAARVAGATTGSDLVTTAAVTINSLTFANKDFVVTPTGLIAGDKLDIRVTIAVVDAAGATAVIAAIAKTQLLCVVRG